MVGPFPTGSLDEVVCANGEHTMRGYHGEGRGMCHERKSRRCPQEEGGRCRGEGRMKLELS